MRPFVAAVKAGDVAAAKRQFAAARAPYETIEPVAESFGTLDPEIDARVNDVKQGERWTGFHRIEQALWQKHTTKGMGPIADKLLRDVPHARAQDGDARPTSPTSSPTAPTGCSARSPSSKITGEEDRYSHTDLSDFQANVRRLADHVRAARADAQGQGPGAGEHDRPALRRRAAGAAASCARAASFPSYDTIDGAERKRLSTARRRAREAGGEHLRRAGQLTGACGVALVTLVLLGALAAPAHAADDPTAALLSDFGAQYQRAVVAHDAVLAARLRTETRLLSAAEGTPALARLERTLRATRDPLQPWPLARRRSTRSRRARARGRSSAAPARPYAAVRAELDGALAAERAGDEPRADARALEAYALTSTLRRRLGPDAAALDAAFWSADAQHPGVFTALDRRAGVAGAHDRARDALSTAEQTLGDVRISRGTVVADAAIIVFREGLEAVLILAAITASFVGARRRLRRPVLLGGLAGIGATAVTWGLAQLLVSELGTGGLRLEAITGLLAIAVLLVVTNWFFHRVYWSQWIARFNRQRKRLEGVGFLSGQALGSASSASPASTAKASRPCSSSRTSRSARAPPRACWAPRSASRRRSRSAASRSSPSASSPTGGC